jgi:hypothetical protein
MDNRIEIASITLTIFAFIVLMAIITIRVSENTKLLIQSGYIQVQKIGSDGVIWVKN